MYFCAINADTRKIGSALYSRPETLSRLKIRFFRASSRSQAVCLAAVVKSAVCQDRNLGQALVHCCRPQRQPAVLQVLQPGSEQHAKGIMQKSVMQKTTDRKTTDITPSVVVSAGVLPWQVPHCALFLASAPSCFARICGSKGMGKACALLQILALFCTHTSLKRLLEGRCRDLVPALLTRFSSSTFFLSLNP